MRGFLYAQAGANMAPTLTLRGWRALEVQGWTLRTHPETPVHVQTVGKTSVIVVVGDIFVAHGKLSLREALDGLAAGKVEPFDDLSGKFALLLFSADNLEVMNDPLGSQGVYYRRGEAVVGSHAALVAQYLGLKRSRSASSFMALADQSRRSTTFLPGDLTMFDGVHMLVPNNWLNVATGRTSRYWPHSPTPGANVEDAAVVWDEYFTNYARHISQNFQAVLGVTGGVDSRSIIATLRRKGLHLDYETWDRVSHEERLRIDSIVTYLGGRHRWISTKNPSRLLEFEEVVEAASSAAGFTRGSSHLTGYIADGADKGQLFIYGHGVGVMRGSFNTVVKPWLPKDILSLAYRLYAGPAWKGASTEFRRYVTEAFAGFMVRGNYSDVTVGADVGDLLYWENRMANWASPMIAAHTVATNAHAGFNSRKLFRTFWGVDDGARLDKRLNRDIASAYDAKLMQF